MQREYIKLLLLAALVAVLSSLLVFLFHGLINFSQLWLLGQLDDFSSIKPTTRVLLPFVAISLLLLLGRQLHLSQQRLGIPLVIQHLRLGDGRLPWRNTLHQFIGGYLALSMGFAVGREGPIVHLGAATSAALAYKQNLSSEMTRKLSASGVAAAITLIFATPLASISFVMEVLIGRWRHDWLPPLLVAAGTAMLLLQGLPSGGNELSVWLEGDIEPLAITPQVWLLLPLFGLLCGALGLLFNQCMLTTLGWFSGLVAKWRFLLAASLTAGVGLLLPHTLGTVGAVYSLHAASPDFWYLLCVLAGKLLLITTALGLGIPGGVIGPLYALGLLLGLCCGELLTLAGVPVSGELIALLGLAAISGAVLQAPFTSLLTVLELSGHTQLLPAALLVVLPAWALQRIRYPGQSIFLAQLERQGIRFKHE